MATVVFKKAFENNCSAEGEKKGLTELFISLKPSKPYMRLEQNNKANLN